MAKNLKWLKAYQDWRLFVVADGIFGEHIKRKGIESAFNIAYKIGVVDGLQEAMDIKAEANNG